jgi:hypothetical protein
MCTHAFVCLWLHCQVFCCWMFHYGCCRLKKQVALESRLNLHQYNNRTIEPNDDLAARGFSMFRGQEGTRWVCSHCWAVNNPGAENIFIRPSSLVDSLTFHPKMGTCRFQNIFCARFKLFTVVLMKTEVLCGVTLSHCIGWVLPVVSKGHSDFFFMVRPSKNAWIWSWKHQNPLKCQQHFAQQRSVTSLETWIFKARSVLST